MKAKIIPYIIPVLSLGLSILLIFYIVIPKYKSIQSLRKERESLQGQLTAMTAKTGKLSKLFASTEIMKSYDSLFTKALPDEEDVPTLMNQIKDVAEESAVVIQNMQFARGGSGQVVTGQVAKGIIISLSVAGNFSTMQTFLKNIENASRLLDISNVSLASDKGALSVNLQVRSFYYVPEGVKSLDEPLVLDLDDPTFGKLVSEVKEFKYYETRVDVESGIGKQDPFRKSGE